MGAGFAHGPQTRHGMGHYGRGRETKPENVTVNGTLQLVNGHIAVALDNKTYYAANLHHLAGFVDGFKEGAPVTLEGSAWPLPDSKDSFALITAKLTLNGKDYKLKG